MPFRPVLGVLLPFALAAPAVAQVRPVEETEEAGGLTGTDEESQYDGLVATFDVVDRACVVRAVVPGREVGAAVRAPAPWKYPTRVLRVGWSAIETGSAPDPPPRPPSTAPAPHP